MKQIEQALDMRPGSTELGELLTQPGPIIDALQDYLRNIAIACHPGSVEPSRACLLVKTLLEASYTHGSIVDQGKEPYRAVH